MDISKSVKKSGDDLKKVMSDLSKDNSAAKLSIDKNGTPSTVSPPPPPTPTPAAPTTPVKTATTVAHDSDLDAIKLDAVSMLKPLIGALDISPEEKFEAMIEIIRASDDQEMIAQAFATAKGIEDNDRRAQALIDIINEINYINKVKKS